MIQFIIGLIAGFVIGFIPFLISFIGYKKQEKKEKEELSIRDRYTRRGLLNRDFSIASSKVGGRPESVKVQYEIGELESTDDMSKIEIISCISGPTTHQDIN